MIQNRTNENQPDGLSGIDSDRIRNLKLELKIATWNVRSLFRPGHMKIVDKELDRYDVDIALVQEVRWTGSGEIPSDKYNVCFSGGNRHENGVGFFIKKNKMNSLLKFVPFNDRLAYLRLKSKQNNITLINCYAPTEVKTDDIKDDFYDQLQDLIDKVPSNDILYVGGDMNAKVGKESSFDPAIGRHSLHETSNDNGSRLANLAVANNLVITTTLFPHKNVHKETWISPDGRTKNQIDHLLANRKYLKNIKDIRGYRGADCDSDHNLVIAKINIKLTSDKADQKYKSHRQRYNIETLNVRDNHSYFNLEIRNRFNVLNLLEEDESDADADVDVTWKNLANVITESANEIAPPKKGRSKPWFDEECHQVSEERKIARSAWLQNTRDNEKFNNLKDKRKKAKNTLRRKKRNAVNELLQQIESDRTNNNTKAFYIGIKRSKEGLKGKSPMNIKDIHGQVIENKMDVINRWKEHFEKTLNREQPVSTFNWDNRHSNLEECFEEPTWDDVHKAIHRLKNNKAAGNDDITAELFKYSSGELTYKLHNLIIKIWRNEKLPEAWNTADIVPIYKKGDKLECRNYRGISLLPIGYKIFTNILKDSLTSHAEQCLGEYQSGFRSGRSTTDHIFFLRQILEKNHEFKKDVHQLYIDFEQAYDSVHRQTLWSAMEELNFPKKLINLIKACYKNSKSTVLVNGYRTDPFRVETGLKQGCMLSPILFNIALEKIIRLVTTKHHQEMTSNDISLLAYADDVVIMGNNTKHLQDIYWTLKETSSKFGIKINKNKTKYLLLSRNNTVLDRAQPIFQQENVEIVEDFQYLGAHITHNNDMSAEILSRLAKAERSYFACLPLLKSQNLSRTTKVRIYKTIIRPVATYSCEAWSTTTRTKQKLESFENKILRRITGPVHDEDTGWRRRTNNEVRQLVHCPPILGYIRSTQLRWAGHVARMPQSRLPKIALHWTVSGRRPRGRPRKRWADNVAEHLKDLGIEEPNWEDLASDRPGWRTLVRMAMGLNRPDSP